MSERDLKEYGDLMKKMGKIEKPTLFEFDESKIELINIAQHYYLPIILSISDKPEDKVWRVISHTVLSLIEVWYVYIINTFINFGENPPIQFITL